MTLFILVLYVSFGNKSVCSKTPVQCHPARYDITETWGLFAELTHKCKCSTWFYGNWNHCSTISHPMLCAPPPRLHGPNTSLWILVCFERIKKNRRGGTFMTMARFQEDSPLPHEKMVQKGCSGNTHISPRWECAGREWLTKNVLLQEGFHSISVVAFNTAPSALDYVLISKLEVN